MLPTFYYYNNSIINNPEYTLFHMYTVYLDSKILETGQVSIDKLGRYCLIALQSSCANLHFYQQCLSAKGMCYQILGILPT